VLALDQISSGCRFVLTDRHGGVSRPPYDALDLGDHVGDDPAAVSENRRLLALELGLDPAALVFMQQVHGTGVAVVDAAPEPGAAPPVADALVTTQPGLGLVVLVADCVPVLLAARRSEVVAVAHAGRRGVAAGVVGATVSAMCELGARPDRVVAVVGPAVCGACYEVPATMADEVAAVVPSARTTTRAGTPGLDLRAGVVAQLLAAGVETVEADAWCTVESRDLYSHRRDGVTGRFAGVVVR
jgi:YfiH family protein